MAKAPAREEEARREEQEEEKMLVVTSNSRTGLRAEEKVRPRRTEESQQAEEVD